MNDYISRTVFRVVFIVVLVMIVGILKACLGRKGKKQKLAEKDGMYVMRISSATGYVIAALGIMLFLFVGIVLFMMITTDPESLKDESVVAMIVLCAVLALVITALGIWCIRKIASRMIMFDGEKIHVRIKAKSETMIYWKQVRTFTVLDRECVLYDDGNQVILRVGSQWEGFAQFCSTGREKVTENGGQVNWGI